MDDFFGIMAGLYSRAKIRENTKKVSSMTLHWEENFLKNKKF